MALPVKISDLVKIGEKDEMAYRSFHDNLEITNSEDGQKIVIPLNQLVAQYRYFLEPYLIRIELNDYEYSIYRYQPKRLAYELYNTTEFWSFLLMINNCISKLDFDKKILTVLDPQNIKRFLNELLILEKVIK